MIRRGISRIYIIGGIILIAIIIGYIVLTNLPGETQPEGGGEEGKEGIVLTIITRHPSTIWTLTKTNFLKTDIAKKYNIVDLRFLGPNPVLWLDTIKKKGDIDIAWGGGPTLFDILLGEDLLAPITDEETLAVIDELPDEVGGSPLKRVVDGKIYWVAAAISSFGFIVNSHIIEQLGLTPPETWEDLGSVEFASYLPKPLVAYARPTTSTSHTRIYQIILQKFGWDMGWVVITRMAANGRPYDGSVEALSAVEAGEVAVSIGIDFYGYTAQIEYPGLYYVLPFNESIINGDPIAVLKTSKHKEAAEAFIRWVISVDGQKIWLDRRVNRMPVRADVFKTPEGRERMDLYKNYNDTLNNIGIPFNDTLALMTEFAMRYYFDAVLADVHSDLVNAWMAIVNAYKSGKISEDEFQMWVYELGKPLTWVENGEEKTFTLEFAMSINEKLKTDVEAVSYYSRIWRDAARERYQSIVEALQG